MSTTHFGNVDMCPFTFQGKRLVDMRRVELRRVAQHFGVATDGAKVDLLARISERAGYSFSTDGRRVIQHAPRELS